MIFDDFLKDVPNHRILLLYEFFRLLDRGAMTALFQPVINERLEEFERHLLGKTALMQLQLGADNDDRAAGVVDALTEQVLAEAALLALQGVRERLQRAIVGAAKNTTAPSVVEQRVHRFLQHTF